jgi:hypothetical protein
MIEHLNLWELEEIATHTEGSALIVDLTSKEILRASPVPHINKICSCRNLEYDFSYHCIKCGTSYAKLNVGLNSYEFYSILYKFMEIYSKQFDAIAFVTSSVLPLDFVGSLNKINWTFLPNLPYRRNIIHITNDMVHTDDFFTLNGLAEEVRDRVSYLSIFSDNKEVLNLHKSKIIHSSRMSPTSYLQMILGSSGFPYKYLLS